VKKNLLITSLILLVVLVGCSKDSEPPSISISSPLDGDTIRVHTTTITADASDNKGVEYVEFYIDNGLIAEDSTSPYEYDWSIASYENLSAHSIFATAYDVSDNSEQSDIIVVTVVNRGMVAAENTDSSTIWDLTWTTVPVTISGAPDQALVDSIIATVTIYHQNPPDLDIYLQAPDSTEFRIWHNDFTGPTESITTTYFVDKEVNGTWLLRVYDGFAYGKGLISGP
jgi:subtilisin-like proprotein convertase family protein